MIECLSPHLSLVLIRMNLCASLPRRVLIYAYYEYIIINNSLHHSLKCQSLDNKLYCDSSYIVPYWGKMLTKNIYLTRKFPEYIVVHSRGFMKQFLVTSLCKLTNRCICTAPEILSYRWGGAFCLPLYLYLTHCHHHQHNTRDGPEILASQFSIYLMYVEKS